MHYLQGTPTKRSVMISYQSFCATCFTGSRQTSADILLIIRLTVGVPLILLSGTLLVFCGKRSTKTQKVKYILWLLYINDNKNMIWMCFGTMFSKQKNSNKVSFRAELPYLFDETICNIFPRCSFLIIFLCQFGSNIT